MKNRNNPPVAAPKMSLDALERLDIAYDRLRKELGKEFFSTKKSTRYFGKPNNN